MPSQIVKIGDNLRYGGKKNLHYLFQKSKDCYYLKNLLERNPQRLPMPDTGCHFTFIFFGTKFHYFRDCKFQTYIYLINHVSSDYWADYTLGDYYINH